MVLQHVSAAALRGHHRYVAESCNLSYIRKLNRRIIHQYPVTVGGIPSLERPCEMHINCAICVFHCKHQHFLGPV